MKNFRKAVGVAIIVYCISVMGRYEEYFFPSVIIVLQVLYLILLSKEKESNED